MNLFREQPGGDSVRGIGLRYGNELLVGLRGVLERSTGSCRKAQTQSRSQTAGARCSWVRGYVAWKRAIWRRQDQSTASLCIPPPLQCGRAAWRVSRPALEGCETALRPCRHKERRPSLDVWPSTLALHLGRAAKDSFSATLRRPNQPRPPAARKSPLPSPSPGARPHAALHRQPAEAWQLRGLASVRSDECLFCRAHHRARACVQLVHRQDAPTSTSLSSPVVTLTEPAQHICSSRSLASWAASQDGGGGQLACRCLSLPSRSSACSSSLHTGLV